MIEYLEIGQDGQRLQWREHMFSELLRERGAPDLALEPVLNPTNENWVSGFSVVPDKEIVWQWGNWKSAEVRHYPSSGKGAVEKMLPSQSPRFELTNVAEPTAIEVSVHDDRGRTLAIKCSVQVGKPSSEISLEQQNTTLIITASGRIPTEDLCVEKLSLRMEGRYRCSGATTRFNGKRLVRLPIQGFQRGAIVVFAQQVSARKLLRLEHIAEGQLASTEFDKLEWLRIERWLNGGADGPSNEPASTSSWTFWLNNWTTQSREQLARLRDRSTSLFGPFEESVDSNFRGCLTGLSRTLMLQLLDCQWADDPAYIWKLHDGSLSQAIGQAFPLLDPMIGQSISLDEKLWAIQRAKHPQLAEALCEVGQGVPRLRRGLHLAEQRAKAIASWETRRRTRPPEAAVS